MRMMDMAIAYCLMLVRVVLKHQYNVISIIEIPLLKQKKSSSINYVDKVQKDLGEILI